MLLWKTPPGVGMILTLSSLLFYGSGSCEDSGRAILESGVHSVKYLGDRLVISNRQQLVIELESLRFNYTDPIAWNLISADDSEMLVELVYPAGAEYRHPVSDDEPRSAVLRITAEPNGFRFQAAPEWGSQTTMIFRSLGDHFFGLSEPLQPDGQLSPDLTGAVVDVEVASERDTIAENFASGFSAFYLSSFGYGAFYDTFARGRYEFAINGRNRIHHFTGALDWHLFFGENGVEIHRAYFDLIGEPKKVPLWSMGPIGWRDKNKGGAAEILEDLAHFQKLRIPFTGWWVDRPYSDGNAAWSEMNFGENFENPGEWISTVRQEYGVEFMTWVATAMFQDRRFPGSFDGILTYIDLSDPATVAMYQKELAEKQYAFGVKGHKMDRADEHFPIDELWADATPTPEKRNRYAWLYAKVHHDALTRAWGKDHFNFARAAIHRSQSYLSAIWGGDPRTSWEGLRGNLANGIRAGFLGFPIWGSDVGGYLGEGWIPEDLYLRWAQIGLMSGMFEIKFDGAGGFGEDRMPWKYDPKFQASLRSVFEERMRLLPYLYSLANTSAENGVLMQPIAYRHLDDPQTYSIWNQFYLGEAILVAPIVTRGIHRQVYLPAGEWHQFENPSVQYEGGQTIEVEAALDQIPRFVRGNSIYLTGDLPVGSAQTWREIEPQLTVHCIPGGVGAGAAFVFVDPLANDMERRIEMTRDGDGISVRAPAMSCAVTVELWLEKTPEKVNRDYVYDSEKQLLTVTFSSGEAIQLDIRI